MGSRLVSQDGCDSGRRDGDGGCGSETGMCFPPGPVRHDPPGMGREH